MHQHYFFSATALVLQQHTRHCPINIAAACCPLHSSTCSASSKLFHWQNFTHDGRFTLPQTSHINATRRHHAPSPPTLPFTLHRLHKFVPSALKSKAEIQLESARGCVRSTIANTPVAGSGSLHQLQLQEDDVSQAASTFHKQGHCWSDERPRADTKQASKRELRSATVKIRRTIGSMAANVQGMRTHALKGPALH